MDNFLRIIADNQSFLVIGILALFAFFEIIFGYTFSSKKTKDDYLVEFINFTVLFFLTKTILTFISEGICNAILPQYENALSVWPLWLGAAVYLFADDITQYWYHRSSHEYKWLWKWHRPHHAAEEMGLLVSYREAIWYYLFMPNILYIGIFTYLGAGYGVAAGIVIKQLIVISSHSTVKWDAPFYKNKALLPIIKVLERIFITPAFHHGHHARSIIDGIGYPNGNFGNMFSFWDQLFGSAKFTHAFPEENNYGLQVDKKEPWYIHTLYPLIKSDDPESEISKHYKFEKTTKMGPTEMVLKEGDYLYCNCGYSKNQPFCDGSHHGTKIQPSRFTIKKEREYKLCNCKLCKKGPFCDNSHLRK